MTLINSGLSFAKVKSPKGELYLGSYQGAYENGIIWTQSYSFDLNLYKVSGVDQYNLVFRHSQTGVCEGQFATSKIEEILHNPVLIHSSDLKCKLNNRTTHYLFQLKIPKINDSFDKEQNLNAQLYLRPISNTGLRLQEDVTLKSSTIDSE